MYLQYGKIVLSSIVDKMMDLQSIAHLRACSSGFLPSASISLALFTGAKSCILSIKSTRLVRAGDSHHIVPHISLLVEIRQTQCRKLLAAEGKFEERVEVARVP